MADGRRQQLCRHASFRFDTSSDHRSSLHSGWIHPTPFAIASKGELGRVSHPNIPCVHRTGHLLIIGSLDNRTCIGENGQFVAIDREAQEELVITYLSHGLQPFGQCWQIKRDPTPASTNLHCIASTQAGATTAGE